jgi:hypothetical protein
MTRFAFAAMPVASSAGLSVERVGRTSSTTVMLNTSGKLSSPSITFTLTLYVPALNALELFALKLVPLMLKLALLVSPAPATSV